jgi:hypothetical protein
VTEASEVSSAEEIAKAEKISITVQTEKYENEQLTFTYENQSYTLPLSRDNFKDDLIYYSGLKQYSEQIINNTLGENVTAVLTVDEDMTKIYSCDVMSQNGKTFTNTDICKLVRKGGSICELVGTDYDLQADLNDLITSQKINYADTVEDVLFLGYLFNDGNFVLNQLFVAEYDENGEKSYEEQLNRDFPCFFGTVQSYDEETAEILLNDGKTVCNVPTYYCDGDLQENMQVMVTLDCDTTFFDSGEIRNFDYAVIYTNPEDYNIGNKDFDTLAYAYASKNELGRFVYTTKDKLGASE